MRIKVLLLGCVGVLACLYAFWALRSCSVSLGELKRPLAVSGAQAKPDGGSLEIHLAGADGKRLTIKRSGSLEVESSNQSLHVVEYVWLLPMKCSASKGSHLETEVKQALREWLSSRLSADQQARLVRNDQDALRSIPFDVIAAFDVVSWIDRRH